MKNYTKHYQQFDGVEFDYVSYEPHTLVEAKELEEMAYEALMVSNRQLHNQNVATNKWYKNECLTKLLMQDLQRYFNCKDVGYFEDRQLIKIGFKPYENAWIAI